MTADRPLTRRELRERERAREQAASADVPEEGPEPESQAQADTQESEAQESQPPADVPPASQAPRPSRRALREVARETTTERAAVRRRPVQAPTTTGLTVVDQATGAISAVPLDRQAEPEEQEPEPPSRQEPEPPPRQEPEPEPDAGAGLRRRSVMGRSEEASPTRPPMVREPWREDTGEDAGEAEQVGRSALATVLRFLVLLVAAFVVGALIWLVADGAAAGAVALTVDLPVEPGGVT